jgi:alcohol dehydrogenase class IV
MMAAASMGATAFQKGLGAIHSLSHPVGALYDAHHGLANGVFMPYVLAFNRAAIAAKLDRLARYLGLVDIVEWTLALRREIGIPHTADALGVEEARIPELARMAAADPTAGSNPVPVGAPELERLYRNALDGRL